MSPTADRPVALVTGTARGIGLAAARRLQAEGHTVVRADVLPPDQWVDRRVDDHTVTLDVRDTNGIAAVVDEIRSRYGRLDVLVNNAGVTRHGSALETTDEIWDTIIGINLTGAFKVSRACYPLLAAATDGNVVNLGSTSGQIAVYDRLAYSVSKAGVMHMTRVMAYEWASAGIRVNAVCPTIVATEMTAQARQNPDYVADKLGSIPLGRMATVEDVAAAVCFLAGPDAGMVTGQQLFVDGGVVIH